MLYYIFFKVWYYVVKNQYVKKILINLKYLKINLRKKLLIFWIRISISKVPFSF